MLHGLILAAQNNLEAAGFILKGIKGVLVAIGSIIAAIVCAVIAGVKGRGQDSTVMLTASANGIAATAVSATRTAISSKGSSAAKRSRNPSIASVVVTSLANGSSRSRLMIRALQSMR